MNMMNTVSRARCLKSNSSTFLGDGMSTSLRLDSCRLRARSLEVVAYKKKGKKLLRQGAGGVGSRNMMKQRQTKPPELPVDPDNEEFIMFVRSNLIRRWIPYTVMKGGWSANALAKAQGTKWGKNLYGDTLVKNIAQAFYKDIKKTEASIRGNIPLLKDAEKLEYGFKIRNKEKPGDWYKPEDVQLLPSQEEAEAGGLIQNVQDIFSGKKKLF